MSPPFRDGWVYVSTRAGITFRVEVRGGIVTDAAPVARRSCLGRTLPACLAAWMPCDVRCYPEPAGSDDAL